MSYDPVMEEMWSEVRNNSFGVCAICSTCGGSSASYCQCAKARFMANLTQEQINEHRNSKKVDTQKRSRECGTPIVWDVPQKQTESGGWTVPKESDPLENRFNVSVHLLQLASGELLSDDKEALKRSAWCIWRFIESHGIKNDILSSFESVVNQIIKK